MRLRNRIVHGYWSVDLDVLLATANDDLPTFLAGATEARARRWIRPVTTTFADSSLPRRSTRAPRFSKSNASGRTGSPVVGGTEGDDET